MNQPHDPLPVKPPEWLQKIIWWRRHGWAYRKPVGIVLVAICIMWSIQKAWDYLPIVPSGLIAYFESPECPTGWRPADSVRGRYVVGVNAPGELGGVVGSSLRDKENRATGQHKHQYVDRYNKANAAEGYLSGGGSSGSAPFDKTTYDIAGAVDGTNAPYIQLLACIKK